MPSAPKGMSGLCGKEAAVRWGVDKGGEEAGWAFKMCYRYFPKVNKLSNCEHSDKKTVNVKNELDFPSDMKVSLNARRI